MVTILFGMICLLIGLFFGAVLIMYRMVTAGDIKYGAFMRRVESARINRKIRRTPPEQNIATR